MPEPTNVDVQRGQRAQAWLRDVYLDRYLQMVKVEDPRNVAQAWFTMRRRTRRGVDVLTARQLLRSAERQAASAMAADGYLDVVPFLGALGAAAAIEANRIRATVTCAAGIAALESGHGNDLQLVAEELNGSAAQLLATIDESEAGDGDETT